MTQEDKELLLKDLCARLPYGVKLGFYASATKQTYICTLLGLEPQKNEPVIAKTENGSFYMLAGNVKPYLFPLSSMTEEQKKEYNRLCDYVPTYHYEHGDIIDDVELCDSWCSIDYLIANHFDYRNLIDKNLAIDATGKSVY